MLPNNPVRINFVIFPRELPGQPGVWILVGQGDGYPVGPEGRTFASPAEALECARSLWPAEGAFQGRQQGRGWAIDLRSCVTPA